MYGKKNYYLLSAEIYCKKKQKKPHRNTQMYTGLQYSLKKNH